MLQTAEVAAFVARLSEKYKPETHRHEPNRPRQNTTMETMLMSRHQAARKNTVNTSQTIANAKEMWYSNNAKW